MVNIDRIFPPQYRQSVGISCYSVNIFKEDSGHRRASQTLCRRLERVNVHWARKQTLRNNLGNLKYGSGLREFEVVSFWLQMTLNWQRKKSRHSLIPFAAWSKRAGFEYKKKKDRITRAGKGVLSVEKGKTIYIFFFTRIAIGKTNQNNHAYFNENEKNLKTCRQCGQVIYELTATYSEILNDKYMNLILHHI